MKKLVLFLMLLCLGSMIDSNARIVEITSKEVFDIEYKKEGLMVAVFYATWCGPCKQYMQFVKNINNKYAKDEEKYEKICFATCNVDEVQDVAISCGILDVPTTIIYKDGQIRWYFVGIKSEQELKSMIDVLL